MKNPGHIIKVIYTRQGESAEEVIARLARDGAGQQQRVVVASNDQEVRGAVVNAGGQAACSADLAAHLNAPPRLLAQGARYRQEARRRLEGEDGEARSSLHTKGNPRRPKRKRRGPAPPSPF